VDALDGSGVLAEKGHGPIVQDQIGSLRYLRQVEELLALTQRANAGTIVALR